MIWNPGQLPEKWTLDDLMNKHTSSLFNPDIANVFFRAGLIESWGRGVERIIEACQQDNYAILQWKFEPGGLWVTFPYPEEYVQQVLGQGGAAGGASDDLNVGVADDYGRLRTITDKYHQLGIAEKKVLLYLLDNQSVTRKEVVEILCIQKTKAHEILSQMLEKELVLRHGQGRSTHYKIKHPE